METYIDSNNELVIVRTGGIYPIGTPKRNRKAMKALEKDKDDGYLLPSEYEEAVKRLKNNLR